MTQPKALPALELTEALRRAANNIVRLKGRARRSEFWWTILAVHLVYVLLTPISLLGGLLLLPVGILLPLATIPLACRRLHDGGHSGWWLGGFVLLVAAFAGMCLYDLASAFLWAAGMETAYTEYTFVSDGTLWPFPITDSLFGLARYMLFLGLLAAYQVVLIFFFCTDSQPGPNRYGPSPKYVTDDDESAATPTPSA